jgi:hypothetical protein
MPCAALLFAVLPSCRPINNYLRFFFFFFFFFYIVLLSCEHFGLGLQ